MICVRARMWCLYMVLSVLAMSSASCHMTKQQWDAFTHGLHAGLTASTPNTTPATKLMLFGGYNHKTYLGCWNCSENATDSIFNEYGTYGSEYSGTSIYNSYSQYGSAYSNYSACNLYATDPPVIVDHGGNFYGRLTINRYNSQAFSNEDVFQWLEQVVCS